MTQKIYITRQAGCERKRKENSLGLPDHGVCRAVDADAVVEVEFGDDTVPVVVVVVGGAVPRERPLRPDHPPAAALGECCCGCGAVGRGCCERGGDDAFGLHVCCVLVEGVEGGMWAVELAQASGVRARWSVKEERLGGEQCKIECLQ